MFVLIENKRYKQEMFHSIYETLVSLVFLYIFLKIVKTFQGHFASHITCSYCKKKDVHIIIITEEMYVMQLRLKLS